jgi:hypothetical protein
MQHRTNIFKNNDTEESHLKYKFINNMKRMRKCNDEVYQLAKDQALVKKFKKTKDLGLFVYALQM